MNSFLGVPTTATFSHQLWLSFWSALGSGIIYSLFVGIIIAVVLRRAEHTRERNDEKRQCARELRALVLELRLTYVDADLANPTSARDFISEALSTRVKEIKARDITLWLELLPKKKDLISNMIGLRIRYKACLTAADRLDAAIEGALMDLVEAHSDKLPLGDEFLHKRPFAFKYCLNALAGLPDNLMAALFGSNHQAQWQAGLLQEIRSTPNVEDCRNSFLIAFASLGFEDKELRKSIEIAIPSPLQTHTYAEPAGQSTSDAAQ